MNPSRCARSTSPSILIAVCVTNIYKDPSYLRVSTSCFPKVLPAEVLLDELGPGPGYLALCIGGVLDNVPQSRFIWRRDELRGTDLGLV